MANAQAVLASSCALNSRSRGSAALAIASSSVGAACPALANAQAVLARPCALNLCSPGTAASATAAKIAPVSLPSPTSLHLARPCAIFDSCLASHEPTSSTVRRSSRRISSR